MAVERQIRVKGPDAEKFVDYVITRDASKISTMRGRYVIFVIIRAVFLTILFCLELKMMNFGLVCQTLTSVCIYKVLMLIKDLMLR